METPECLQPNLQWHTLRNPCSYQILAADKHSLKWSAAWNTVSPLLSPIAHPCVTVSPIPGKCEGCGLQQQKN